MLKIYQLLLNNFGKQNWWPSITGNKFEIAVGAILTQNTSWENVDKVIEIMNEKGLLNRDAIRKIPIDKLAKIIRQSGYYNQKARKLKEFAKYNGKIERDELLKIWGIGKETADSILLYAYNKPYFVVDAYTKRIFSRLGLLKMGRKIKREKRIRDFLSTFNYEEIRKSFESNLPRDIEIYKEFHALIVKLGKIYCKKKPLCKGCPLLKYCKYKKN